MYIPSLIIQPFVENAVLHGMKYKENGDGKIIIEWIQRKDLLLIKVIDNGPGIENTVKESNHDSQGLDITGRRLKLIEDSLKGEKAYVVESSEEGTRIELRIPIVDVA